MSTLYSRHPEAEDPRMAGHDDEAAEIAAIKLGFEAAESALSDAADAVGSALVDLTAADGLFELVPELTQCVRVLALVKARVAERLACLPGGRCWPGVGSDDDAGPDATPDRDRRLEIPCGASEAYSDSPPPAGPAESTAPVGRTRVPAGEGSGLYLGAPRETRVHPPAAPLVERDMVRDFARSVLAEPLLTADQMRPLWAEGDGR